LIIQKNPGSRIILMTMHNEAALVEQSLTAGALGYWLKLKAEDELRQAIHSALEDKRFISPQVSYGSPPGRGLSRPPPEFYQPMSAILRITGPRPRSSPLARRRRPHGARHHSDCD